MIWLYVILAILILIIALTLLPLHIVIKRKDDEGFKIKIKVLCFNFNLYSESSQKEHKKVEREHKEKRVKFIPDVMKKRGVIDSLKLFSKILNLSGEMIKKFIKGITLNKMKISIDVGASNAASAAIKYGQVSALLYPSLGFITSLSKPKEYSVKIRPDFLKEKISMNLELDISTQIFYILFIFLIFAKKYSELT